MGVRRFATPLDLAGLVYMVAAWAVTGILPRQAIPSLAATLASLTLGWRPRQARQTEAQIERRLGTLAEPDTGRRILRLHLEHRHEHVLGRVLDSHRQRWQPAIELVGREHLEEARSKGRGAVLWGMSFCGPVIPKMALHRAGVELTHLSTPWHGGFSQSWIAFNLLNRWAVAVESRYLAARVVIPADGSKDYQEELKSRLRDRGCVSIQGENRGRRSVTVRILGTDTPIAAGAPALARATGAALLTVTAHRVAPFSYRVMLGSPIDLPAAKGRVAVEEACHQFASRLEAAIRSHPADWERWSVPATFPW